MEFRKMRVYNPNSLNIQKEIQPLEFARESPLKRLDYLIGFLKKNKPEIMPVFVQKLEKRYEEIAKEDYVERKDFDVDTKMSDFPNLEEFPQLAKNNLNYFLSLLEISSDIDWVKEKVKTSQRNYFRSFLGPKYNNVEILTSVVDREEAIQLYKIYITEYILSFNKDSEDSVDSLDSLWEKYFKGYEDDESESWVVIQSKPSNGKLIFRKDVCLWADSLDDFPDSEFKYLICCYGDFQGAKRENKHFIYTMKHTIAKGDPYCSCVFHDTRIDWDLTHPPKEFWNEIWPLHEWQKKE